MTRQSATILNRIWFAVAILLAVALIYALLNLDDLSGACLGLCGRGIGG